MNNIRIVRERAGLTQSELAKLVGRTSGAICHYETGRRRVGIGLCQKFIHAFKKQGIYVTIDDLFPPKAA
ncbi:helix-turn-helix transcriptional regulator [Serratia symbiotica]|uniref:helix-turn-helix transcriptional regulator n=1 Tax=Serratia symbiotica TaxID=138074 RepID=UPI00135FC0C5|nr:helix-turn-helix transcriptional regulator [Serratia symbiotica]MBQ0955956.1 helix-turn-helix transcriptional regulator [Serratia symbiotica]